MPKMLGINIGFVTNSSSVVYHFPKALLKNKDVKAFLRAFEIEDGFVGDDLWGRDTCGTLAVTKEQKLEVQRQLNSSEYSTGPGVAVEDEESFVVVIGDEHADIAQILSHMLHDICTEQGLTVHGMDYN